MGASLLALAKSIYYLQLRYFDFAIWWCHCENHQYLFSELGIKEKKFLYQDDNYFHGSLLGRNTSIHDHQILLGRWRCFHTGYLNRDSKKIK